MADELLRHIQTHYGELRKVRYMENGKPKQLLTGQAVGVLLSMAGHAHHRDFVCYAGLRTISEEAGINLQNCSKWLNLMVDAGWLIPDGKEPSSGGRPSNRYIVSLPGLPVPQPSEMPKPGSFDPAGAPANVPTNVPAIVPTNVPAGSNRTEQEQNINTHTKQKRVGGEKALKEKLEAVAAEWAQRQLKADPGTVKNPAAWLRSVAKTVTTPTGSGLHYKAARELIEESPDASPEVLCDHLENALELLGVTPSKAAESKPKGNDPEGYFAPGSGWITRRPISPSDPTLRTTMPYDLREKRLLSIYQERGYGAALDYTDKEQHTPAEADQLKQALNAHALSEAGIEQDRLRMSDEEAQQAAQLEAGYTPEHDAEMVRQLEAGLLPEAELARQLESGLEPDPVAQLAARFTDRDT